MFRPLHLAIIRQKQKYTVGNVSFKNERDTIYKLAIISNKGIINT